MPRSRYYTLTKTAAKDFRQAKQWLLSRWGKEQTKRYFADLHRGAEYIAQNQQTIAARDHLTAQTGLGIYPLREHYIIYLPIEEQLIIVVALIRQVCDVPAILQSNQYRVLREIKAIKTKLKTPESL